MGRIAMRVISSLSRIPTLSELGDSHPQILLLPGVKGLLAYPHPPADLAYLDARLCLLQGLDYLLLAVTLALHPGLLSKIPRRLYQSLS
jgi:hypothetical protein